MTKTLFDLPFHGPVTLEQLLPVAVGVGLVLFVVFAFVLHEWIWSTREKARAQVQAQAKKPAARRWSVVLIPLAMLPLIWLGMSGCVCMTKKAFRQRLSSEYYGGVNLGAANCAENKAALLQQLDRFKEWNQQLLRDNSAKTERLRKFKQVDDQGRLRCRRCGRASCDGAQTSCGGAPAP